MSALDQLLEDLARDLDGLTPEEQGSARLRAPCSGVPQTRRWRTSTRLSAALRKLNRRRIATKVEAIRRDQAALRRDVDRLKVEKAAALEEIAVERENLKAEAQRIEAEQYELEQTQFYVSQATSELEILERREMARLEESPQFVELRFTHRLLQNSMTRMRAENQDLKSQVATWGARGGVMREVLEELAPEKLPALRSRFRQKWEAHEPPPRSRGDSSCSPRLRRSA